MKRGSSAGVPWAVGLIMFIGRANGQTADSVFGLGSIIPRPCGVLLTLSRVDVFLESKNIRVQIGNYELILIIKVGTRKADRELPGHLIRLSD